MLAAEAESNEYVSMVLPPELVITVATIIIHYHPGGDGNRGFGDDVIVLQKKGFRKKYNQFFTKLSVNIWR